jgi:hypothetical protein
MPVDCTDWSLSPLFAGVPLVPAVNDSARLPMGEGALVLAGLTYLLSLGRALTTTNPARSEKSVTQRSCCALLNSWCHCISVCWATP